MEDLAKKYHKTQYRNRDKVPYIEHLIGVRSLLLSIFEITNECNDSSVIKDLSDAALGHDLIEDTEVTKDEIIAASNENVLHLIEALSNPVDDAHTEKYMEQLSESSEEARIIKYCDLLENTTSVCYGLHDLGLDWTENFYLPILRNTTKTLADTSFEKFPNTARLLREMLKTSSGLLFSRIELAKEGDKLNVR